ncbi:MAG: hypothetical protein HY298_12495 [Verrucomicrobia bacterium]|nr:hypothetical protein [Verrucomicrobiota bacterium]
MNDNDLEQRLQRQTLRPIPTEWRAEILSHANDAPHSSRITHPSLLSTLNHQLSTILWPCPKAWAGLAAVWLIILTLNFATGEKPTAIAKRQPPPSPEMLMVLKEQEKILAELLTERSEPRESERPKPGTPSPRSERRHEMMMV